MTDINQGLPIPQRVYAAIAISAGSMVLSIDVAIAAVVLPTIATDLHIESSKAIFIVTAYQLILAMVLMPFAALGSRIGLRRLYAIGLVLHAVAGMLVFIANDLTTIVIARALQAVGTAAGMSVATGMVRFIYPIAHLGKGMSLNTVANAGGTALAPVLGGLLIGHFSWHWVFIAALPLSMLALSLIRTLPKPDTQTGKFDLLGSALCAATFGLFIGGIELAMHGSNPAPGVSCIILGLFLGGLLVRYELRQTHPVLPVDLLALPKFSMAIVANFCATQGTMVVILFMPFYLQNTLDYSPTQVGGLMATYALASLMIAPTSGYLSDHIPVKILCIGGMCLASVALLLLLSLTVTDQPEHWSIAWRLWLCGAGFSMFFSPNARQIIAGAPIVRAASAASMFTTTRTLGQTMGALLVALLLAMPIGSALPFLCALALAVIAGVITFFQPK